MSNMQDIDWDQRMKDNDLKLKNVSGDLRIYSNGKQTIYYYTNI